MNTSEESIDRGIYGAKRQSFREANPCSILEKAITDDPGASQEMIFDEVWGQIGDDLAMMRTVFEYWFTNNYRRIIRPQQRASAPATATRQAQEAAATALVRRRVEERAVVHLMAMFLPNGKTVGDTTGRELRAIAPKMSSWLGDLAQLVPHSKTVRQVFNEDQLQNLYNSRAS